MNDDAARDELIGDEPLDEDAPAPPPEAALYWTACFLVSQCFGGRAEGGWWFTQGELVTAPDIYRALGGTPRSFLAEDDACAYAARLRPKLAALNEGRPPKHSAISQGVYEVHVLQAASLPPGFPAARSRYE